MSDVPTHTNRLLVSPLRPYIGIGFQKGSLDRLKALDKLPELKLTSNTRTHSLSQAEELTLAQPASISRFTVVFSIYATLLSKHLQ